MRYLNLPLRNSRYGIRINARLLALVIRISRPLKRFSSSFCQCEFKSLCEYIRMYIYIWRNQVCLECILTPLAPNTNYCVCSHMYIRASQLETEWLCAPFSKGKQPTRPRSPRRCLKRSHLNTPPAPPPPPSPPPPLAPPPPHPPLVQ